MQKNWVTMQKKALKAISDFEGKPLVTGGKYITLEGEEFIRTVIWEFNILLVQDLCFSTCTR
jgi:uncharacterized protein (DUF1330 family)